MTNHPNRGWRTRLRRTADQWLSTDEAELLSAPVSDQKYWRVRLRLAYLAGLRDGEGKKIDLITLDGK